MTRDRFESGRRVLAIFAMLAFAISATANAQRATPATAPKSPPKPPPGPTRETIVAAIENVLLNDGDARRTAIDEAVGLVRERDVANDSSCGLERALLLLRAADDHDRESRIAALEAQHSIPGDDLANRLVDAALERDPVWYARTLDSDSVYSTFAGFFDGIVQTAAAALTGNPVGTLQPLVVGIEGVLNGLPIDPRDRARLALERRLRLEGLEPELDASLTRRIAKVHDQTAREELWLSRRALDRDDLSTALAHLRVAEMLEVRRDEIHEARSAIEARAKEMAKRLEDALAVAPIESRLVTDSMLKKVYPAYVEAYLSRNESAMATPRGALRFYGIGDLQEFERVIDYADALRRVGRIGRSGASSLESHVTKYDRTTTASRSKARLEQPDLAPFREITDVKAARSRAAWRFVFTGRREDPDPLGQYTEARRAETRIWLDYLVPILWIPATLVRAGYSAFGNPIDDHPVIDAEARFARREPDHPARKTVLVDLAGRYENRADHWKALLALREAGASASETSRVEKRLVDAMLDEEVPRAVRRSRLEWLKNALPNTDWSARAHAELAKMTIPDDARPIPLSVAMEFIPNLAIEARLCNGDSRDGEVEPSRIEIVGDRAFCQVRDAGKTEVRTIALSPEQSRRASALADEWQWRYVAGRAETYRGEHHGVPVEIYAGLGVSGVSLYPRLQPETFTERDRRLW